jgi:hypothetical protein
MTINIPRSLFDRAQWIKSAKDDWDGYGAKALDPVLVDQVVASTMAAMDGLDIAEPWLVPGGDGSLQVEWHLVGIEASYTVDPDPERGSYSWYRDRFSGFEQEWFGEDALPALFEICQRISKYEQTPNLDIVDKEVAA